MIMLSSTCMSIAISIACILIVTLSWIVLNWIWFTPKGLERILRKQGFRGNSYKLFYGDSKEKDRMAVEAALNPMSGLSNDYLSRIYPFYDHTLKNYGKRCFMWHGPIPVVNIADPELMREVFMKINEFQKPQINPIYKLVATGVVQLEGEKWAKRRKLLNPAFHMEKLKLMLPSFSESSKDMINKWDKMMSDKGSCEVEVWSHLLELSGDVISRTAFGSNYDEGREIFELVIDLLKIVTPVVDSFYIPGWRFVPTRLNRKIMQVDSKIKSLLKDIINKRLNLIKEGEKPKGDLLGILLDSSFIDNNEDDNKNKKDNVGLSFEEVIDECKIFYLSGYESISSLLLWTLILLCKHQDWQEKAREEVMNEFGDNTLEFHGLTHLKIVNMILQEVLRLYPGPDLTRTVLNDIKVGDFIIPAGVIVNLPIIDVHQDEKIWGADAKEFKPERFTEGILNATSGNMSFFSFGFGPRICIGANFAMTQARLGLVLILKHFSFELSPSYMHAPIVSDTLMPQFGAQIIFKRLKN